jgi:peptidoglycan-associated lipoprotein
MEDFSMKLSRGLVLVVFAVLSIGAGCAKKKVANATPPAPPAPAQASTPAATPASQPASTPAPVAETPRSRMPDAATRAHIGDLLAKIEDAYFDYNKASLRTDAIDALKADSSELRDILKDFPDYKITIEGLCDERGSAEYNMALGEKRAESAKTYLVGIGIPADQFKLVTYGKEKAHDCKDDACWQKDRHVHFVAMAN